ncbi:MAG TPA: BREX system ATP-binding protein BrxD, partial [Propionibacterium sp.]|nr:BREX system ATP-binding protein BrxD [Propionibacterium sp.]
MTTASPRRRREVIDALRRGTVPSNGLDLLAVGLDRFSAALDAELDTVAQGGAVFKAVRGEYGSGKTFFTRHLAERALRRGFATAEVQISETQTPLHRLETVYRRVTESLRTSSVPPSAFRSVLDSWLFTLEDEALAQDADLTCDALGAATDALLEGRLAQVSARTPAFAQALRGYRAAGATGETATADALAAWLGGQPHVAAAAKRAVGVKGDLDHFGAMAFLQGLLLVLRDAGHPGLLVVLDEVETLQRVRGDVRDKALNALRQLIDEVDAGRFPGLYLVITGTPAFFDGRAGVGRLAPLAQRLATDFTTDVRFDNPRAVQVRLPGFDRDRLVEL